MILKKIKNFKNLILLVLLTNIVSLNSNNLINTNQPTNQINQINQANQAEKANPKSTDLNSTASKLESTLALIKPEAVLANISGDIIKLIELNGFTIKDIQKKQLTKSEAEEFYKEHKERPFYKSLVEYITSGPIVILKLEKANAIKDWRSLMGSTNPKDAQVGTIRKMFGASMEKNAVHGSDSSDSAKRELAFFFK